MSEPVVSEWTEVPSQRFQVHSPVNVSNSDQFVVDGRLNAKIIWSYGNRPLSQASCFYQVSWAADYQAPHSVDFIVVSKHIAGIMKAIESTPIGFLIN